MYYIYILTNQNNNVLYTGVTNNLPRRMEEHINGINKGFSQKYNTKKLVYYECFEFMNDAIAREKYLKGKKEASKIGFNLVIQSGMERSLSDFVKGTLHMRSE